MPQQDPRPTRSQIVARVRQRLGPSATPEQIADIVADVELALAPATPSPTGPSPALAAIAGQATQPFAADVTAMQNVAQGPLTGTGAVMTGVLEAIPQIAPGAINFVKDAFLSTAQTLEAGARNVAGEALAPFGVNVPQSSREEKLALPRFAYETVKGLIEPVADVMALAANVATGTITEEDRLEELQRAGFTLTNLLALEAGGRLYRGAVPGTVRNVRARIPAEVERSVAELRRLTGRDPTAAEVRAQLERIAPRIIAEEMRAQPTNGVQNPVEVGTRSASQAFDALRTLTEEQFAALPFGRTPPLSESAAAPGVTEGHAVAAIRRIAERERRQETRPVEVERRRTPPTVTPTVEEIRGYREGQTPGPADIVQLPVSEIIADPGRFQFKSLGSEGVSGELKGVTRFNKQLAGVVSVWRDPADGKIYVVNGHHRLELAKRLGVKDLNVQFIDAPNATMARAEGAFINIAEGRGTATDVAKFLRDMNATAEDLAARGVTLKSDLVRDGTALARLAPDVFDQVTSAKVPQGWGVAIGELLTDPVLQREALKAAKGSSVRLSQAEVSEVARQVRDAGTEATTQETLFGAENIRRGLFVQKAQLAAAIKKRLGADRRLFGYVSQEGRAQELTRAGETRIDVGAARDIADASARVQEVFDRLYTRSGPIADILTEGARRVAHGEKPSAVAADIYAPVGDAVRTELTGGGARPHGGQRPVAPGVGTLADEIAKPVEEVRVADSQDISQGGLFGTSAGVIETGAPQRDIFARGQFADAPPTPGQLGVQSTPEIQAAQNLAALRIKSERELGGPAPVPSPPGQVGVEIVPKQPSGGVLPSTVPDLTNPQVAAAQRAFAQRPGISAAEAGVGTPIAVRPGETLLALKDVSKQEVTQAQTAAGQRGAITIGPRQPAPSYKSANPEIEAFFEQTARPESVPKHFLNTVWEGMRERFQQFSKLRGNALRPETAPFETFFADAREVLRQGIDAPRLANAEALTLLNRVVHRLTPGDLDVFRRMVVARDLVNTASRGLALPRGLRIEDFQTELRALEGVVRQNPALQDALAKHVELMKTMTAELVQRGVLTPEAATTNPHYFPHQVLDYIENRIGKGTPGKIKKLWRGYAQARTGTTRDIYTDYLEVMYSHLAKTLRDNRIDDIVVRAGAAYDITTRPFPERAARAEQLLTEYQNGTRPLGEGQSPPRTVRELPDEALAEAGYTRFYPKSPRAYYAVRTLPEGAITRVMEAIANDPELKASAVFNPEMFREAMAVGRGEAYLLPTELADVLNNYRGEFFSEPSGFVAHLTRGWKQLVLNVKPLRYNRRNLIGDLERMNAAVPGAWRSFAYAIRDQMKNLRGQPGVATFTMPDGSVRPRYELAAERSVISSGKTAVEVGRLRDTTAEFEKFLERGPVPEAIRHPLRWYGNLARKASGVREDWARLAVFYHNLDRIATGKPLDYGVSNRRIVDAIGDPIDRAAKISRDAMGDYQGLTRFENGLRNGVVPFYAWLKINSTFWPQLVARQSLGSFSRYGMLRGARATAWLASRVAFVYVAAQVWNNMAMGEQEDDLPDHLRRQWHFNTGMRDEHGRWITLTDPTALDDFFQTVGLDGASPELRQLFQGQLTFAEYLERRANDVVRGPVRSVLTMLGPVATVPLAAAGKQTFPDPFRPRDIPPYERIPTMLQQLGVPAEVLNVAEQAVYNPDELRTALMPDTRTMFDVAIPSPLGVTTTAPMQDPALVREAMTHVFELEAAIRDIERRQFAILSGLSMPNATDADRRAEVTMLEARLEGYEQRLGQAFAREAELRRRSANR